MRLPLLAVGAALLAWALVTRDIVVADVAATLRFVPVIPGVTKHHVEIHNGILHRTEEPLNTAHLSSNMKRLYDVLPVVPPEHNRRLQNGWGPKETLGVVSCGTNTECHTFCADFSTYDAACSEMKCKKKQCSF